MEDVQAIADLCKAVLKEGENIIGRKSKLTAGVSTFIPKPHTPFQWSSCDTLEQIHAKQELLKKELRKPGLKLNWNNPLETMLESVLSRGDRRLSEVIYTAWKLGAKFDAWHEHFDHDIWLEAFAQSDLDPDFYTHRNRPIGEVFSWEHISTSVQKKFLQDDYLMSKKEETRVDCRNKCFGCGILPTYSKLRMANPGEGWQCPEVKPHKDRKKDRHTL